MENASKALITAGAILLSVLFISLGIMVFNNAKSAVGGANLNKEELAAFNSQWETYTSKKQLSASELRTMFSAIIANNVTEKNNSVSRLIKVECAAGVLDASSAKIDKVAIEQMPASVSASKTFKVSASYSNGLITLLTITN